MGLTQASGHHLDLPSIPSFTPVVFVVDEDISIRASLEDLIGSEGWQPETFASAEEFLAQPRPLVPNCLILALSSLRMGGLEVQKRITRERTEMPITVISGEGDIPTSVEAMKAGAVDFFVKPLNDDALLDAIRRSLERSRVAMHREAELRDLRICYASLTTRERQVMMLVVSGLLNKQVGGELGISEITVKFHRGRVMQKMKAKSLADLVRIAGRVCPERQAIHLA
jgi:FixJ family two-component response regulator